MAYPDTITSANSYHYYTSSNTTTISNDAVMESLRYQQMVYNQSLSRMKYYQYQQDVYGTKLKSGKPKTGYQLALEWLDSRVNEVCIKGRL